jgi:hypothetical protein
LQSVIKRQAAECLFANWQGIMIGNGEVWIEASVDNKPLRIIALNLR